MEFLQLFKELNQAHVRYLLVGGLALNLHGVNRTTGDIDIIIYLEDANVRNFLGLMSELGYQPQAPVDLMDFANPSKRQEWKNTKHMIVFSLHHPEDLVKVIDVFVESPLPFEESYEHRVTYTIDDIAIPVISIPDLIKLKELAGRKQDASDIEALKKVLAIQKEETS